MIRPLANQRSAGPPPPPPPAGDVLLASKTDARKNTLEIEGDKDKDTDGER